MKKSLIVVVLTFFIASCNTGQKDGSKNDSVSKADAEREAKIEAKREAYYNNNAEQQIFDEVVSFEGKVKLTVLVPSEIGLSDTELKMIESKLIQMATVNGVGGLSGSPRFVLAPDVMVVSKDVTTTAPPKHLLNYDITFYVADIVTGTVFATENIQMKGVGESDARAFLSAFKSLNVREPRYQKFIQTAQEKILTYCKTHGKDFIKEADMLASQGKYAQAMAILSSIPLEAEPYYDEAVKKSTTYFQKYLDNECGVALSMMKTSLGSSFSDSFNETAMNYYSMIPANGNCKSEADAVYAKYIEGLNAEKKHLWEQEEKEWQAKMAQQSADNAFRAQEAALKARIEMSANDCLLDKYKKDAGYNKLPWIRKVFHLGDLDPFDGYKPKECC